MSNVDYYKVLEYHENKEGECSECMTIFPCTVVRLFRDKIALENDLADLLRRANSYLDTASLGDAGALADVCWRIEEPIEWARAHEGTIADSPNHPVASVVHDKVKIQPVRRQTTFQDGE